MATTKGTKGREVVCRCRPTSPCGQQFVVAFALRLAVRGRGDWQKDGGQKKGLGTTNFTKGTNGGEEGEGIFWVWVRVWGWDVR